MSRVTFSQGFLNIFVVKSFFSKCKTVTKKEIFCRFFFFFESTLECCSREGITRNGAKIKLLCNIRMIHLADLFVYPCTLTPSVDYAVSLSGRSRLVVSEYAPNS